MGGHLLSDDDLRKIEARNKATPGEWRVERTCCEENMFSRLEERWDFTFDPTDEDRSHRARPHRHPRPCRRRGERLRRTLGTAARALQTMPSKHNPGA